MPKQTFFNLPEEKRNKIINISLLEFAQHSYRAASVSQIVENAGIAKGSMYQYFENKIELYLYLVNLANHKKLAYIEQHLNSSIKNFYELYKQTIFLRVKFDLENPRYSTLIYNAYRAFGNEELRNVARQLNDHGLEFIKKYIIAAQKNGQVRTDIDIDLIAFTICQLTTNLEDYMRVKFDFDYRDLIGKASRNLPISDKKLEYIVDELIEIFKDGFEPKNKAKA